MSSLSDPDVYHSVLACDVEHTSFHFGLCGRKFVLCLFVSVQVSASYRGVAKYIMRLISYDFISQHICIRWVNSYSDFFTSTNGVKQGGILSSLFFNVYMDNLNAQLNSQHTGCSTGDVVVNHMLYADDIALFSPSAKGLQKLLDTAVCVLLTDVE